MWMQFECVKVGVPHNECRSGSPTSGNSWYANKFMCRIRDHHHLFDCIVHLCTFGGSGGTCDLHRSRAVVSHGKDRKSFLFSEG